MIGYVRTFRFLLLIPAAIAVVFASGCTAPYYHHDVIDKEVLQEKYLAIKPVASDDIAIVNVEDFDDDWSELESLEAGKVYFANYINEHLRVKVEKSAVPRLIDAEIRQPRAYRSVTKLLPEVAELTLNIPEDIVFADDGITADYLLVIGNLVFRRMNSAGGGSGYQVPGPPTTISTPQGNVSVPGGPVFVGGGGGSSQWLDLAFDFMIWDVANKKAVSYGSTSTVSNFVFAMTQSNWEAAAGKIANKVLWNSPFQQRSRARY